MNEPTIAQAKRTHLYDAHKEAGATFGEWYGWKMPTRYSNQRDEHAAVRDSVGFIDLSHYGAIKVGGTEGPQFLNGLVTNDVKALAEGRLMSAGFLTGHGKVRALSRILSFGDEYLIITDPQTHEKLFKYVFPFSYAGDFTAADVSDDYRILTVQGPKSILVMKEACFEPIPKTTEADWFRTKIAGHNVIVAKARRTGEIGFDILAPREAIVDAWDFLMLKGDFHGGRRVGQEALEVLRIEAGQLVYGKDVDETNMMLETGMSDAVSFTKGCYTGQEAVAMATYRGHVSKKMCGLLIDGDAVPAHGDSVLADGKEIGYITSATRSEIRPGILALAYLKYGFTEVGGRVDVQTGRSPLPATISELPFHRAQPRE